MEVYLNLGYIGLFLLFLFVAACYRNICKRLKPFSSIGSLALAIWTAFLFHNSTEADFRSGLMWLTFVLAALAVSVVEREKVSETAGLPCADNGTIPTSVCFQPAIVQSEEFMSRLRILVLAPDSNPEQVSIPYVTYSHAAALAELHDVTLVIRSTVEDPVRRANAPFHTIEVIRMPWLERIYAWCLRRIFKSNFASQAVTAFGYPFALPLNGVPGGSCGIGFSRESLILFCGSYR